MKYQNLWFCRHFHQLVKTHSHQLSPEIAKDPLAKIKLADFLAQKQIDFKKALENPLDPGNKQIILEHHNYFWDPRIPENSQLRGFQLHLSHQMFSDYGFAGNGIEYSGISAALMVNNAAIATKHIPNVIIPV